MAKYIIIERPNGTAVAVRSELDTPSEPPLTEHEEIINELYNKVKKEKYYFKYNDSERRYSKSYFDIYMKENNLEEIEVYEAIWERIGGGVFWCKEHSFCGDETKDTCGRSNCKEYQPRNKISGVCKHHSCWFYVHGDKIVLKSIKS